MVDCPKDYENELKRLGANSGSYSPSQNGCLPNVLLFPIICIAIIIAFVAVPKTASTESTNTTTQPTFFSYAVESDFPSFPTIDSSLWENLPQDATANYSAASPNTSSNIVFISYPQTARRNEDVSVKIKGSPNTKYSISVEYSSGTSTADGLKTKYSNSDGYVTWTWHVGGKTNPGTFPITVTGGGKTKKVFFTVVG